MMHVKLEIYYNMVLNSAFNRSNTLGNNSRQVVTFPYCYTEFRQQYIKVGKQDDNNAST